MSEQERVRAVLGAAVREFGRNSSSRGEMRQCAFETPEIFLREGLRILLEADDSAGCRFLAILLMAVPSIVREICDRWQWTREEAVGLAKRLIHFSPNFDTRITDLLPLGDRVKAFGLAGESAERALDILDEISPGPRIVARIRHLTSHPDEKISSKAALLIGKRCQDLSWARQLIGKSKNPRVRANTIESFWGMNIPAVIELFRECLKDGDNRVVGNAIIGLHASGDSESLEVVAKIAEDSNPKRRMTAAWIMGRIGSPKFISVLSQLARDANAEVRRAALRSLRSIHVTERKSEMARAAAGTD
jgi:HEAT repeats